MWLDGGLRWRRTVPLLVLSFTILTIHLYGLSMRDVHRITNTLRNLKSLGPLSGPSANPNPLHVLLVSYARSGSSFIGDLLQSLPGNFYHFEPLHFLSSPVLNDSFDEARELLAKVFTCNVSKIEGFLKWQEVHKTYMKLKRSFRYWQACSRQRRPKNSCYFGPYIDSYCQKQDTVIVKTIRLKLPEAAKLFETHPHLNLKIIYLIRDPRGSISSRTKYPITQWCKQDPTCSNTQQFCNTLQEDLQTACTLMQDRPHDFTVLRYDDLAMDPFSTTDKLVRFLGLGEPGEDTINFLKTHTNVVGNLKEKSRSQGVDYPYSTFRNSSITATSWRFKMPFRNMMQVQTKCSESISGFGYHLYTSPATLKSDVSYDLKLEDALQSSCKNRLSS